MDAAAFSSASEISAVSIFKLILDWMMMMRSHCLWKNFVDMLCSLYIEFQVLIQDHQVEYCHWNRGGMLYRAHLENRS